MRSRDPRTLAVLSIMAIVFLVGISSMALAGNNPSAKMAIHVKSHNAKQGCGNMPVITGCADITTTYAGFSVDAFPVFYDLTEYKGFEYGLTWPAWQYSAAFTSCSDLVIGAINWPDESVSHAWTLCQEASVGVPSFLWLYADAPGQLCPTISPATGDIRVLDCSEGLDEPCGVFCAGVYGGTGDNACTPCEVTFDPLIIDKYDDADVCVDPSGTLTYTIRYTNPNTAAVNSVVLADTLPAEVNFVSATGGGSESGGVVTWNFTTLAGEAVDSVDVVVEVDPATAYGITLLNAVSIVSTETDLANIEHSTTVCDFVYAPLNLVKSGDVATCAFPGDEVIYKLVYENPNEFEVTNVALSDNLPNNADHDSSTGGFYDDGSHSVAWDLGTLAALAKDSVYIYATLKAEAPQGSFVNNTCQITGLETGSTNDNLLTAICACLIEGPTEVCPEATAQFTGPADMESWAWVVTGDGSIPGATDAQTVDVVASQACPGSYELELTVVDGGVPSTCYYTVTVNDTEAPIITECAGPITVECVADIPAADIGLITATDNCDVIIITHLGDTDDGGSCPVIYTRAYEAADRCGNADTCYQEITVDDTTPPTIDTCPGDMTVECISEVPAPNTDLVTGTDNCGGAVTVTYLGQESDGGSCPEHILRGYEVADVCGNADTCYQEFTIDDTTPPEITFCPANDRVACGESITFGTPTANDNCDGAITPTTILDESVAGPEAGEITHRRGWEMIDACSNADTCYQEIVEEACTYVPLTLSKDDDITTCVEREANITYTISYGNTNTLEVTNVVLSDEMPAGVTYVSSSPAVTPSGSTVDWNLGTLGAGATGSVELVVSVNAGTTPGITLTNNSTITSNEAGSANANVGTQVCAAVYDPLILSKDDDITTCVERDANITYTINYSNPNDDGVTGVVLEDVIPAGTNYVSSSPAGTESAGTVTWNIGSVAGIGGGSVELVVQVDAATAPGITLTNNCSIDSDQTGSTPAIRTTDVCAASYGPLNLDKVDDIGSGCVDRGANITYTISYDNPNGDPVTNVILTDTLSPDVDYVSSAPSGSEVAGVVTWNIGTLTAGASGSVELVVQVKAGTTPGATITNACSIDSDETEATPDSRMTTVCSAAYGPLYLVKTASPVGCVGVGSNITYTIDYENNNGDPVTGVVLTDTLPAYVDYVSSTGGGSESGGIVTWNLGTLAGSGSGSVDLTVVVTAGITPAGTILNTCAINSNETGETRAQRSVSICDCHIEGTMAVCPNSTTIYGTNGGADSYEWFITGNGSIPGDNTLQNVDVLAGSGCGASFTLQVDRVQNGGMTTCYLTVDVEDNIAPDLTCPPNGRVACGDPVVFGTPTATDNCVNPVTINEISTTRTAGPGPGEFTNERCWEALDACNRVTCCQTIIEEACAALIISKTDDIPDGTGDCVEPGGNITYTISFENPNSVDVPNVIMIDDLPPGVNFVSATLGGVYDGGQHRVTWDLGTLFPGDMFGALVEVEVSAGAMPGSNLLNVASIGGDNTVPASDDNSTAVCGSGVMPLNVDIKPGSCPNPFNTKSKGKLPVAIVGSGVFDVYDIDPSSARLDGVPIAKYEYRDVATPLVGGEPCECHQDSSDGYLDLIVYFNRPALTTALGPVTDGEVLELILMATTYAGQVLQGSDCILIKQKPNNGQAAPEVVVTVPDPEATHILLTTGEASEITLVIYDVHGRTVARLLDEYKAAGSYEVIWNGKSNGVPVPAGVYFATASNPEASTTTKFVVVR